MVLSMWSLSLSGCTTWPVSMAIVWCRFVAGDGIEWFRRCGDLYHWVAVPLLMVAVLYFCFALLQGMVVNGFVNVAITISLTFDGCCMIFLFCFVTGEGSEWFCQCGNLYHWAVISLLMVAVWYICFVLLQGMVVNGFVNVVISNIERRYDLTSTETGTIASCYDIASVLCLIPVSYFGGLGCKPRYLGEELTPPIPPFHTHPYHKEWPKISRLFGYFGGLGCKPRYLGELNPTHPTHPIKNTHR